MLNLIDVWQIYKILEYVSVKNIYEIKKFSGFLFYFIFSSKFFKSFEMRRHNFCLLCQYFEIETIDLLSFLSLWKLKGKSQDFYSTSFIQKCTLDAGPFFTVLGPLTSREEKSFWNLGVQNIFWFKYRCYTWKYARLLKNLQRKKFIKKEKIITMRVWKHSKGF